MKIISIVNLKGGVAKSTTAINMSYLLASKGKRVLIVDNDIQANSSAFFSLRNMTPNITDVFRSDGDPAVLTAAIRETRYDNLHILPSTIDLAAAVIEMSRTGRITTLRDSLRKLTDYDYIIIDNAPNMTANVINAIFASDEVLVPTDIDGPGIDGLTEIQNQVAMARGSGLANEIRIAGIIITKYDSRTKMDREGAKQLRSVHGDLIFKNMIHASVKVKEATIQQVPIVRYDRRNHAAQDYIGLVDEYLAREAE